MYYIRIFLFSPQLKLPQLHQSLQVSDFFFKTSWVHFRAALLSCITDYLVSSAPTPTNAVPGMPSCDDEAMLMPLNLCSVVMSSSAVPLPMQTVTSSSNLEATPSIIDIGSGGSGVNIPEQSPTTQLPQPSVTMATPSPSPISTPAAVIIITLNLTVEGFRDLEANFTAVIVRVLSEEANLTAELIITIDEELSTNTTTVVQLYVRSEAGGADDQATVEAFMILSNSNDSAWLSLQEEFVSNHFYILIPY